MKLKIKFPYGTEPQDSRTSVTVSLTESQDKTTSLDKTSTLIALSYNQSCTNNCPLNQ